MRVYSVDANRMSPESFEKMAKAFAAAGWECPSYLLLGENDHHCFVNFVWPHDEPAVAPEGYKID